MTGTSAVQSGTCPAEAKLYVGGYRTQVAVGAATGSPVYRLPPGEIVGGVYRSDDLAFDVVADSMAGLLERLRDAVAWFTDSGAISDL